MKIKFEREEELTAADWKHMYCILLRGMDAALEHLPDASFAARRALETSMDEAEEYYISRDGCKN